MKLQTTTVGPNTKRIELRDLTPGEAVFFARLADLFPKRVKCYVVSDVPEISIILSDDA